jgi:hypothetical protein
VAAWYTQVPYVPRLWRREFFCIFRFIFSFLWSALRGIVNVRCISVYGRAAISFLRLSISMVVTSSGMDTGSPQLSASVTWMKSGSGAGLPIATTYQRF